MQSKICNKQSKATKLKKIQTIQFVLCTMVVFLHSHNVYQYNLDQSIAFNSISANMQNSIVYLVFSLAVLMFFFISAYLMFRNYSFNNILHKYKSRFKSIFIPYILWNTIYLVALWILSNISIFSSILEEENIVTLNIENIIQGIFFHKYSNVLWFLQPLILLSLLSPIIYIVFRTPIISEIVIILMYICPWPSVLSPILILPRGAFFYFLGAFVALRYQKIWEIDLSDKGVWICRILFIVVTALHFKSTVREYDFLFVILIWFSFNSKKYIKFSWINTSFFIYLTHILVVTAIKRVGYLLLPKTVWVMNIMFVAAPVITIFFLIIVAEFLKKHVPIVYEVLTGER